jgi:hypothetical protein
MAFEGYLLLGLLVFLASLIDNSIIAVTPSLNSTDSLNRSSFPADFIFGTASSSYQVSPTYVAVCIIIGFHKVSSMRHLYIMYVYMPINLFLKSSMKVRQMKVAKDQIYGIFTPIDIQVFLSLSWKQSMNYQYCMQYILGYIITSFFIYSPLFFSTKNNEMQRSCTFGRFKWLCCFHCPWLVSYRNGTQQLNCLEAMGMWMYALESGQISCKRDMLYVYIF